MAKNEIEVPEIEAVAVKDERKHALLFDLWVGGKWVGSRRTIEQCEDELTRLCGVKISATYYGSALVTLLVGGVVIQLKRTF